MTLVIAFFAEQIRGGKIIKDYSFKKNTTKRSDRQLKVIMQHFRNLDVNHSTPSSDEFLKMQNCTPTPSVLSVSRLEGVSSPLLY